jgi:hypothetical protein
MRRAAIPLLVVLLGAGLAGRQQRDPASQPQIGKSSIAGTVFTTDNPAQPVRHATVTVSGGGLRTQRQTMTDNGGRFVVADLPAGSFSLSVARPSFISINYGASQPGQPGTPIAVTAGERAAVEVRMPRGAVLSGTVVDQYGRPRPQVRMQALFYRTTGGQRRLQQAGTGSGATDDRGMFRLYGLQAGDYVLRAIVSSATDVRMLTTEELRWAQADARPGPSTAPGTAPPALGQTIGFAPIYFPGVPDLAAATTITLNAGEERLGMNFQLQPTPTATIEGLVVEQDGRPAQQTQLTLVSDERMRSPSPPAPGTEQSARFDNQTGKFTISGVPPGRYTLVASRTVRPQQMSPDMSRGLPMPVPPVPPVPPAAPAAAARAGAPPEAGRPNTPPPPPSTWWALTQVDVNGQDITGLTVTLQPPLTISGRLVFESPTQTSQIDPTRVRISVSMLDSPPISSSIPSVPANADGTFTLRGAVPGRYRVTASLSSSAGQLPIGPWILKSVFANGRESLDAGLEVPTNDVQGVAVTLTDQVTDLSGTLLNAAGTPTRDYWVMVFSTDRAHWTPQSRRTRVIRPSQDGRFRFGQWPPGEYYMVAVTDGDQMDLTDRTALEQIAAVALKITLAEGEKKVQDLKLAR